MKTDILKSDRIRSINYVNWSKYVTPHVIFMLNCKLLDADLKYVHTVKPKLVNNIKGVILKQSFNLKC